MGKSVSQFGLRLFAYCLMRNHFHLFLQTPSPNLPQALWYLQSNYARYFNLREERIGPLFQGRYRSRIVTVEAYAFTLVRYIHQNPIEAGIVREPADYPWSSYPCYVGKLPKWKWLEIEWLLTQLDTDRNKALESFKSLHERLLTDLERRKLERARALHKVPGTL